MTQKLPLPTAGEMLREEFRKPMAITPYQLAKDTNGTRRLGGHEARPGINSTWQRLMRHT